MFMWNQKEIEASLSGKINIEQIDDTGATILCWAARYGKLPIVKFLLENHKNIMNKPDHEGRSPLHWAIQQDDIEITIALLGEGADVNCNNYAGLKPLHLAVYYDNAQIVRELIAHGAEVNQPDKEGKSPLHWAIYYARTEVVLTLIAHGAEVNQPDEQGRIPLHCITRREIDAVSIMALITNGADVDHLDNENRSPLYYAAYYGQTEILKILIGVKANVNMIDERKSTPLHAAVSGGKIENVKALIYENAKIDAPNEKMATPLHLAASSGRIEIIKALIEAKANIEAVDACGDTPLFNAVFFGHTNVVKFMVSQGANIHHINNHKQTLLDIACSWPQPDMHRLLIDCFRISALWEAWELETYYFDYYLQWLPREMLEDVISQFEYSLDSKKNIPVTSKSSSLIRYAPFPAPFFSYLLSEKACPEENNIDTAMFKKRKTR